MNRKLPRKIRRDRRFYFILLIRTDFFQFRCNLSRNVTNRRFISERLMKLLVGQLNTVFRRTCRCNCSVSGVLSPAYLTLNNSSQDLCHYNDNCRTSVYCVVILLFGFYAPATHDSRTRRFNQIHFIRNFLMLIKLTVSFLFQCDVVIVTQFPDLLLQTNCYRIQDCCLFVII